MLIIIINNNQWENNWTMCTKSIHAQVLISALHRHLIDILINTL